MRDKPSRITLDVRPLYGGRGWIWTVDRGPHVPSVPVVLVRQTGWARTRAGARVRAWIAMGLMLRSHR